MIYIVRIDKICDICGFRNKIEEESPYEIEIVACGKCGTYLSAPDNMTKDNYKEVNKLIKKEIKHRKEK